MAMMKSGSYYDHEGHSHRIFDMQMVNIFTGEILPDQWCPLAHTIKSAQRKVERIMSTVKWCDVGNHAFSGKDKKAESYTRTVTKRNKYDEEYDETEEMDVCGTHASKAFPEVEA